MFANAKLLMAQKECGHKNVGINKEGSKNGWGQIFPILCTQRKKEILVGGKGIKSQNSSRATRLAREWRWALG
jgi:hypothetical protein